jgi:hypothetical protein
MRESTRVFDSVFDWRRKGRKRKRKRKRVVVSGLLRKGRPEGRAKGEV